MNSNNTELILYVVMPITYLNVPICSNSLTGESNKDDKKHIMWRHMKLKGSAHTLYLPLIEKKCHGQKGLDLFYKGLQEHNCKNFESFELNSFENQSSITYGAWADMNGQRRKDHDKTDS